MYSARIGNRKELKCSVSANPAIDAWEWRDENGDKIAKNWIGENGRETHGKHGVKLDFKQTTHVIEKVIIDCLVVFE